MKRHLLILLLIFSCILPGTSSANNVSVIGQSLVAKTATTWDIQFTVSWDNSWCSADAACSGGAQLFTANWDAVWLFAKFSKWNKTTSSWGDWTHCTVAKDNNEPNTSHTEPVGARIKTGCSPSAACGGGDTGTGIFIYHSAAGVFSQANGNMTNFTNARMRWLFTADGVSSSDTVKIKLFGVEMVYIPQGNFWIGDGSATPQANFRWADGTSGAVQITNTLGAAFNGSSTSNSYDDTYMLQGAGAPGNGAGIRIDGDGGIYDSTGVLTNASFPTGYNAFYIMKYEASQAQYKDFLNTLTRTQQNTRIASQTASYYTMSNTVNVNYRSGIRNPASIPTGAITFINDLEGITAHNTTAGDGIGNESNDGGWVAANYISWMDVAAFTDWAALRPFTELEFEKACRGPQVAVADEYAWGNTTVETATTSLTNSGTSSELPNQGNINYSSSSPDGPYRVGGFADGSSTRQNAGASYYGVLDLSGSLWERPVTVGNPTGRAFAGTMGNGVLSTNGNANNSDWPGYVTSEVTGATGAGWRGGFWSYATVYARVSDRLYAAYAAANRSSYYGVRSARTSP